MSYSIGERIKIKSEPFKDRECIILSIDCYDTKEDRDEYNN